MSRKCYYCIKRGFAVMRDSEVALSVVEIEGSYYLQIVVGEYYNTPKRIKIIACPICGRKFPK